MSQDTDKRELLKLKQGLINESESIGQGGYDVRMPLTVGERIKNTLWYARWIIAAALLVAAVTAIIFFAVIKRPVPDIAIYSAENYSGTITDILEKNMVKYIPDYNGDGVPTVTVTHSVKDPVLQNTDLYEEVLNGHSQVFIGKKEQLEALYDDMMKADGVRLFSDLSDITGAEGYLININDTVFGQRCQIFSTEIYIALRNTDDENRRKAEEFLYNLLTGKVYEL